MIWIDPEGVKLRSLLSIFAVFLTLSSLHQLPVQMDVAVQKRYICQGQTSVADEESDASEADSRREAGSAVSDSGDSDSEDISGFESCSEHGGEAAGNAALIDDDDGERSSDEEQEPESDEQADGARCSLCEASIDLAPEALVALPDKRCDGVCDRELPRREMRYRCPRGCDFDICTACAGAGRAAAAVGAAATAEA